MSIASMTRHLIPGDTLPDLQSFYSLGRVSKPMCRIKEQELSLDAPISFEESGLARLQEVGAKSL